VISRPLLPASKLPKLGLDEKNGGMRNENSRERLALFSSFCQSYWKRRRAATKRVEPQLVEKQRYFGEQRKEGEQNCEVET